MTFRSHDAPADARAVIADWSAPLDEGGDETVHARFLAQAAQSPHALALSFEGGTLTYGELELRSRAFAVRLMAQGVGPGDRVAILAERGPQLIWAILGAARLGAIFVVLDSAYPAARLQALAAIAAPSVIVRAGGPQLAEPAAALARAFDVPAIDAAAADGPDAAPLAEVAQPQNTAYFLFTSGSTGQPKGVACSHQPLTHFVDWHARTFDFAASDVFSLLSGLSHDPLLRDIFTPLSLGASLAIPSQALITEPGALAAWLKAARASVVHLTPALGLVIAAGRGRTPRLPDLRHLFWGGDQLTAAHVGALADLAPQAEQTNFYGCTETPQAAGYFRRPAGEPPEVMPVGSGIDGFQLLVVDEQRRPLGVGAPGEIAVRSNYLSLGYVADGRPVPPDDRGADPAGRRNLYFTGDRGVHLPDGSVLMQGRQDDQLSVRGYRVDLSEVTAALLRHPEARAAAALARRTERGSDIIAFIEMDEDGQAPADFLASELPAYMQPREIVRLDRLPMSPNGKVDRQALQPWLAPPPPIAPAEMGPPAGATDTLGRLVEAWSSIFNRPVSPQSNFVGLDGDSLTYVQAYLAAEEILGELPTDWDRSSLADLSRLAKPPQRRARWIETPMLIRAAAIVLVVLAHAFAWTQPLGATTALMLVSGYLFGGLGLRKAFADGSGAPILRAFTRLLIPVAAVSAAIFCIQVLRHKPASLSLLLLSNDLVDYRHLTPEVMRHSMVYLWYVDALLKVLLAVYLAFQIASLGRRRPPALFPFVGALFLFGCLLRFVAPIFLFDDFLAKGAQDLAPSSYAATAHLATFALGALLANAAGRVPQAAGLAALVGFSLLTAPFYGLANGAAALLCGLALIRVQRLQVPRPVAALAFALSGASLYIYLAHMQLVAVAAKIAPVPDWLEPAFATLVGLAGGYGLWRLVTWTGARLKRRGPFAAATGAGDEKLSIHEAG